VKLGKTGTSLGKDRNPCRGKLQRSHDPHDDRSSVGCRPAKDVLGIGSDSQMASSGFPVASGGTPRPFEAGDVIQNPRCALDEAER